MSKSSGAAPGRADVEAVVTQARSERARLGLGPLLAGHRCSIGCQTVGTRRVRVCLESLGVHVCPGASCPFARQTGEATVCGLSGFEVCGPNDTSVSSFSQSNGVTASSSRHWGHVTRTTALTQKRAEVRETDQMTRKAVEDNTALFLSSSHRGEICAAETTKVHEACVRAAKMARAPPSFSGTVATVTRLFYERAALCAPPALPGAMWLSTLATAIFRFWQGLRMWIPLKKKNAAAMTAAILTFMADGGLSISGVVYVRPSRVVAAHCPRPRQFGMFRSMTCRRITQQIRAIKAALTLPSGRPRLAPPLEFD
jgi:hypothetical protein